MVPPNDSPFWGILRLAVVGTIFCVGANFLKDWIQLISLLIGSGGISYIQGKTG